MNKYRLSEEEINDLFLDHSQDVSNQFSFCAGMDQETDRLVPLLEEKDKWIKAAKKTVFRLSKHIGEQDVLLRDCRVFLRKYKSHVDKAFEIELKELLNKLKDI